MDTVCIDAARGSSRTPQPIERAAGAEPAAGFERIQTSLLAGSERRLIDSICDKAPAWLLPDHLTLLGFVGAMIAFVAYLIAAWRPGFLFLASFGIVLYWFGDSHDGSLARRRRIERPRYGYFTDNSVDTLCDLAIMSGLGLSSYVRLDVALFTLVGYYLMGIHSFLSALVIGKFRLSFVAVGPTELRLLIIALNTIMYYCGHAPIPGIDFGIYDGLVASGGSIFLALFIFSTAHMARRLAAEEKVARID